MWFALPDWSRLQRASFKSWDCFLKKMLPLPEKAAEKIPAAEETGGIEGQGTLRDVYRANLNLRTATRILVTIGEFPVRAFPALRQKAAHLPWERFLKPGQPIALRVACHRSRLYHSGAVAEYVAKGAGGPSGKGTADSKT